MGQMSLYPTTVELPRDQRPKERLLRDGVYALNHAELLATVIGGPTPEQVASALLARYQTLSEIMKAPVQELMGFRGLGESAATKLKAALRLGQQMAYQSVPERERIRTPADAAQTFIRHLGQLDKEEMWVMSLDTRNGVIALSMAYRGSVNAVSMRIGELFREAIRVNAAGIIIAHNHPSGDPSPSSEDVSVTRAIQKVGKQLDVDLQDHLVVAGNRFVSLKERGLGFE